MLKERLSQLGSRKIPRRKFLQESAFALGGLVLSGCAGVSSQSAEGISESIDVIVNGQQPIDGLTKVYGVIDELSPTQRSNVLLATQTSNQDAEYLERLGLHAEIKVNGQSFQVTEVFKMVPEENGQVHMSTIVNNGVVWDVRASRKDSLAALYTNDRTDAEHVSVITVSGYEGGAELVIRAKAAEAGFIPTLESPELFLPTATTAPPEVPTPIPAPTEVPFDSQFIFPQEFYSYFDPNRPNRPVGIMYEGAAYLTEDQKPDPITGKTDSYVSQAENVITLFGTPMNANANVIAGLAHNYMNPGKYMMLLGVGEYVGVLVNNEVVVYQIDDVQVWQALDPHNPYSEFLNPNTGELINSGVMFNRVYLETDPNVQRLVLQTCVEANGNPSWGRRFVRAKRVYRQEISKTSDNGWGLVQALFGKFAQIVS